MSNLTFNQQQVKAAYEAAGVTDTVEMFAREAEKLAADISDDGPVSQTFQRIAHEARALADSPTRAPETFKRVERLVLDLRHERARARFQRRVGRR